MTAVGDRVRLVRCNDEFTRLRPGELGTVRLIDAVGTVHVNWDSGSKLGLVLEDGDQWEAVEGGDDGRIRDPAEQRGGH